MASWHPRAPHSQFTNKLVAETHRVVMNEARDKLRAVFTNPVAKSPQDSTKHFENDTKLWREVIDSAKLKFDN